MARGAPATTPGKPVFLFWALSGCEAASLLGRACPRWWPCLCGLTLGSSSPACALRCPKAQPHLPRRRLSMRRPCPVQASPPAPGCTAGAADLDLPGRTLPKAQCCCRRQSGRSLGEPRGGCGAVACVTFGRTLCPTLSPRPRQHLSFPGRTKTVVAPGALWGISAGPAAGFPGGVWCGAPFPAPRGHMCLSSGELSLQALRPCLVGSSILSLWLVGALHCARWAWSARDSEGRGGEGESPK